MLKVVIGTIIAVILVVAIVPTIGYVGYKTVHYMVAQGFDLSTAISWGWNDWTDVLGGLISGSANAEDYYWETEYSINRNINVVGCVNLK